MTQNRLLEVFKGGWEQLEHATFTDNITTITGASSFFMNPNGAEVYVIASNVVETYPLTIPYDPNSRGSLIRSFPITDDAVPVGLNFKDDGKKMFIGGQFGKVMLEYAVPVAYDTSSIVASPVSLSLSVITGSLLQSTFSRDGDFLFALDSNTVYRFPLPTPWDITSNVSNTLFPSPLTSILAIAFKREGDKMYLVDPTIACVVEFDLFPFYDITTAVANGKQKNLTPTVPIDIQFRSNGLEFFFIAASLLTRLHMDNQWNISIAFLFLNSFGIVDTNGVVWKPDGTKFFGLVPGAADRIDEYLAGSPWNVTGSSAPISFSLIGISDNPRGFWWNRDGTRCFVIDGTTNLITQLNLTTGYDITTMSDSGIDSASLSPATSSEGIVFTKDELTFYVLDSGTETVYQFTMPAKLDIANAVQTNAFPIVPSSDSTDIRLSTDERFFYISDRGNELVSRFSLPADQNISNAVFLDSLDISAEELNIRGIYIRETDGKKLWIVGQSANAIVSMDMTLEFNNAIITNKGEELSTPLGETIVYA